MQQVTLAQYKRQVIATTAAHELQALGATKATRAYFVMSAMMKKALGPITLLLLAVGAGVSLYANQTNKAKKAAKIYSDTLSKMGPLLYRSS